MADRVYPAAKPPTDAVPTATNPAFPSTKAQLYSNTRPAYRPQPHHRRRSRSRCCSCCLWIIFIILLQLVIAAIFGAVFYVLYRPHRPTFSLTALKLQTLNITTNNQLTSSFNLNITARNPNKKLVFFYNPIAVSIYSNDVDVADGVIPAFVHGKKNTTLLKAKISSSGKDLDSSEVSTLKADMKSKKGLPLRVRLDTRVRVKVFGLKTPKMGIRVKCDGIRVTSLPTAKAPATASTSNAKCKVNLRVKIWKWTV
ncbi:NDR1/HIN1-like protein 13 [Pyrus communis]|uniref:NDR1/HIN1-like protein 13 n=1 Tax=Pyrus communis TaxID=23211 RepID=UPI0035C1032B